MDVKSQALCPARPRCARWSLLPHIIWMSSVSGPLAACSRVATTSCCTHRPRVLCVYPSIGSRSHALILVPDPLPPFASFGDTVAHTPSSSSESPPLSLILPPLAHAGSAPWPTSLTQHEPSVSLIHVVSTSGALRPISVHHYKMPLVLALLLHPHSHRIRSRATRSSHHSRD